MMQIFVFQEFVCEFGQGVFFGFNMMLFWKYLNVIFNFLFNDYVGYKCRCSFSVMFFVVQDFYMYDVDDL